MKDVLITILVGICGAIAGVVILALWIWLMG